MDEKLIELVRKCEELYDMSNKKYSDSVWKEKQIGEELEKAGKFQCLNSEIIPTRCNICVYSSQWLYSTCFG